jgi:hypothetical protein
MSDRILQKYANRPDESVADATGRGDGEGVVDFGSFGWLNGLHEKAIMLELRKKNGNILAVGYGWLQQVEFDPSEGITLYMADRKILIRGQNLNAEVCPRVRLFREIAWHRVSWIQEADRLLTMQASPGATWAEEIEW